MYSVCAENKDFNTIALEDRISGSTARIAAERGGILTSFCPGWPEIMYLDTDTFYDTTANVRGGCPVLFPICGRLKDKTYYIGDTAYTMEIHGFARSMPWKVLSGNTAGAAEVTLYLESDERTRRQYPFDFRLEYTYSLKGDVLAIRQKTVNTTDGRDMPMSFGLHPYFRIDREKAKVFLHGTTVFGEREERGGASGFEGFTEFIVEKTGDEPPVLDTGLGYKVSITASDIYKYYVVWSPEDAGFACVEPWTALPDAQNTKEGLIYLKPGESRAGETKIRFTRLFP